MILIVLALFAAVVQFGGVKEKGSLQTDLEVASIIRLDTSNMKKSSL
jgi:hypothetical protein